MIYEAIGRLVVHFVRTRYRRQLRVAAVLALLLGAGIGYVLASREVEEG